jgi:hypothetical protein
MNARAPERRRRRSVERRLPVPEELALAVIGRPSASMTRPFQQDQRQRLG